MNSKRQEQTCKEHKLKLNQPVDKCFEERVNYNSFVERSLRDFENVASVLAQKGSNICLQVLRKHSTEAPNDQTKARRECTDFYLLSIDSLLFDTIDELDRTVSKYDFSRL